MIDARTIPPEKLRFTTRMIRDQAIERGWKVWSYYEDSSNLRLERPDGKRLEIFSAVPPTLTSVASIRAQDKYLTHMIIEEAGLPVSETYLAKSEEEALEKATALFEKGHKCVVKPLDAGHGNGITVAVADSETLLEAFAFARTYSEHIIIQEHVEQPIDIRVSCVNFKYAASLVRVPARIKGDGKHTIEELIDIENNQDYRGENYEKALNVINKERAGVYMGEDLHAIPPAGEWLQVLGTANVGTGGETIDVTEDLPEWLIAQAESAARVLDLPVAGVDFLVKAMPTKTMTPEQLSPVIVEVNKCPALFMHETPTTGQPRPVIDTYLDYLASL